MNKIKKYHFLILLVLLASCKSEFLTFDEPGFAVIDYEIAPGAEIKIELVNINTPKGYKSVSWQFNGSGTFIGPHRQPAEGNKKNGYIYFTYLSNVNTTASITFTIEQLNGGESFTNKVNITVKPPSIYKNIGDFLKYNSEYSDLYTIAQKSSYWQIAPGDTMLTYQNKGFTDNTWEVIFFAVPNGTFQPLINRIPQGNLAAYTAADITQEIADNYIGTLIVHKDMKTAQGQRALPYERLNELNNGNLIRMATRFIGDLKISTSDYSAGQIEKFTANYLRQAGFLKKSDGSVDYVYAGSAIIFKLDRHFVNLDSMNGNVEGWRPWRADNISSLLGFSDTTKTGMNGFDATFSLSNARNNFYGSGWWEGVMFIPLNNLVVAAYRSAFPSTDFTKEWIWENRANSTIISDAEMLFMLNFWGTHNIGTISSTGLTNGPYRTTSGDTLIKMNNVVVNAVNSKSANIVKHISWIDGSINRRKTIYVIDAVLY